MVQHPKTRSDALSQRQAQYHAKREQARHRMPDGLDNMAPGEDESVLTARRLQGLPENWKEDFLIAYEETGFVREAARIAEISTTQVYRTKRQDPEFAAKFAEITLDQIEQLEEEAYRRSINGSDILLMFLLRSRKPEVYNDKTKKAEVTVTINSDLMANAQEQLEQWKREQLPSPTVRPEDLPDMITLDSENVEVKSS